MNSFSELLILLYNMFIIVSSNVTISETNFSSTPESTNFELKCEFDLERDIQFIKRVDILKNDNVFYSVEYSNNLALTNLNESDNYPGIHSKHNSSESDGWTSVYVKSSRSGNKPISGSYKCQIHYFVNNKQEYQESESIYLSEIQEKVKFKINHGHKKFHKGVDIPMGCEYKLLKSDKFFGLSFFKDKEEFFRYFNDKNFTFEKIEGIPSISWSSYAERIYLTIKKAQNTTGGQYACLFNFSTPETGDKILTLMQSSDIVFSHSNSVLISKLIFPIILLIKYLFK